MSVSKQGVTYFNFNGGLNTDATPLTRKVSEATELMNMDIKVDGSIQPRRGQDFINAPATGVYNTSTFDYTSVYGTYTQEVPSAGIFQPTKTDGSVFIVVILHIGTSLYIYDYTKLNDLSDPNIIRQTLDLSSYVSKQAHRKTLFLQERNKLFLVNEELYFGYVEYDQATNTFSYITSDIFVRDLTGGAKVDSFVRHNSKTYKTISTHTSASINEPGVGTDWEKYWVLVGGIDSNYTDSWATATGYTSNIIALEYASAPVSLSTMALSSGRLWVAGNAQESNTVYFSQSILEEDLKFTRMYQYADPLNTLDSTTVATDGGSIRITGAVGIKALATFRSGILVFAGNGVWYIHGNTGYFSTVDFSVDKLSSDGVASPSSWVSVENNIIYFGLSNVYVVTQKDTDLLPTPVVVSDKIKTFYNSIPIFSKKSSQATYDPSTKLIILATNFSTESWMESQNQDSQPTMSRDYLVLDTRMRVWYKHSLTVDTDGSMVAPGTLFTLSGGLSQDATVVSVTGDTVVNSTGDTVTGTSKHITDDTTILLTVLLKRSGSNVDFAIGTYTGSSLTDFSKNAVDEVAFSSVGRMAHQVLGDIEHAKQTPYITTIFKRVESFVADSVGDDITPGGCLMRASYNFATGAKAFKYGNQFQAYKPTKWSISYSDGSDPNIEVVKNKHKLRGRGDAIQIEISNDPGKDFVLYGYQIDYTYSRKV